MMKKDLHGKIWERSFPGRRNSQSKGSEAGLCLACIARARRPVVPGTERGGRLETVRWGR